MKPKFFKRYFELARNPRVNLWPIIVLSISACSGGGENAASDSASQISDTDPLTAPDPATRENSAPSIAGAPATFVLHGTQYVFAPVALDLDDDDLSFSVAGLPEWLTFSAATGEIAGVPSLEDLGTSSSITISVTDGLDTSALPSFSITVLENNTPSELTITDLQPSEYEWDSLSVGKTVYVDRVYEFITVPGSVLGQRYLRTANDDKFMSDSNFLSFTIDRSVDVLVAYDSRPNSVPAWLDTWEETAMLTSTSDTNFRIYRKTFPAGEVVLGGNELGFSMYSVIIDEGDQASNASPVILGTPATIVSQGSSYNFSPTALDPDGDALTFSITNRPTWASFSSASGQLSGTPDAGDVGTHADIVIEVSDGEYSAALPAFSITVNATNTNSAPSISGTPASQVLENSPYSFTPSAVDPDGDTLTFSISNRPAWAGFNNSTGALSGTPDPGDVGTYSNIVITVSDGEFFAALPPFEISVDAINTNSAPTISGSPPGSVVADNLYSFTPSASDSDGDALSFSIVNRPAWATFNGATGNLSGTPDSSDVGTYSNISISVFDGQEFAVLPSFSISVLAGNSNSPPSISGVPATSVVESTLYSFTPGASDPDSDPLSFSISNRPAWASFNSSTGQLSGTPDAGDVGSYNNIVISVSDGQEVVGLPAFSITVEAIALGSTTLSWTPPTTNADGTPLTDLAGYKISWGTSSGSYTNSVTINNPGISSYFLDNLVPATYFIVCIAFDAVGNESDPSNEVIKTIL